MEDYKQYKRYASGIIICPICGKIIKGKRHVVECGGLGNWDADYPEYHTYYNFRCKDCGVKASTDDYDLTDERAWTLPKDFVPTITKKQWNYIKYLAGRTDMYYNIILTNEAAQAWIPQALEVFNAKTRGKIDTERRAKLFEQFGYKRNGADSFLLSYKDSNNIVGLDYKDGKISYHIWQRDITTEAETDQLIMALTKIKKDIPILEERIPKINAATEEDASQAIEQEKVNFKKHIANLSDSRDYDYCDDCGYIPDFGDLC